jgi:hypothetical protein
VSTPRKPDLDQLVTALTADGKAEEVAGREAALAAFRTARQRSAANEAVNWRRSRPFTRLPGRLAAAGAALLVAGGAAAAYAQALPGPVQQVAHTVFAPLGVPDGHRQPGQLPAGTVPGNGPTGITIANSSGGSKAPSPSPAHTYKVSVDVARARVPAGGVVVFTGRVTDSGRAAAGVRVRLFERIAGTAAEVLVATGMTSPRGGFRLVSPPVTATAVFRVLGPDAAHSAAVRVAVAVR